MASRVSQARDELFAALQTVVGAPWRVHRITPSQIAAPCLYIGGVTLAATTVGSPGVGMVVATFPVYVVADGLERKQTEQLDDLVSQAWDAAYLCGAEPTDAAPTPLNVGGPNLRAHVVQVDLPIRALTLCAPTLEAVTHG